jgi:hypothetical protein
LPITPAAEKKKTDDFLKVIWKKSKRVGFGSRGEYTIAWYCSDSDSAPNIKPHDGANDYYEETQTCLEPVTGAANAYNKCINEEAIKAVNKRRADHLVADHPLITQAEAATQAKDLKLKLKD